MPTAVRGVHRIHYETFGRSDRPTLLLIMGLGFSSRAWAGLPERMSDRYRVVAYDNRGSGRSVHNTGIFGVPTLADDAVAVLDAAGVRQSFVFGISMGGMIAMELALRHPHRVRSLALGATHSGYFFSRKPTLRTFRDFALGQVRRSGDRTRSLARFLVAPGHVEADPDGFAAWLKGAEHARPVHVAKQAAAVVTHAADLRVRQIKAPTLVITGDQDLLVPPQNSIRLSKAIPGAELAIIPGAGHCFPLERPEETISALDTFFLRHSRERQPYNYASTA